MDKVTKVQVLRNVHGDYVGEIKKDGNIGYVEDLDLAVAVRVEENNKMRDLEENISKLINKFQLEVKEVLIVGYISINITDMKYLQIKSINIRQMIYKDIFKFLEQYFEGKETIEYNGTYYNRQGIISVKPIYK